MRSRIMTRPALFVALLLASAVWAGRQCCDAAERPRAGAPQATQIILRNARTMVGIVPRLGGRVVLLRRRRGKNIMLANKSLWMLPKADCPVAAPDADYHPFMGHVVWVGPQSDWWSKQTVNPERARAKASWPPDPFLVLGDYQILEQKNDYVKLRGPASPISNVQLTKVVQIDKTGLVTLHVTAKNTGAKPVSWHLWSNTRLPGTARCYVPVKAKQPPKVAHPGGKDAAKSALPSDTLNGFFFFKTHAGLPAHQTSSAAKALIRPSVGVIAAFVGDSLFLKRSAVTPADKMHPAHGPFEVFNRIDRAPGKSLMELEIHGPHSELAPGAETTLTETWQVLPYTGKDTPEAQTAFLKKLAIGQPQEP